MVTYVIVSVAFYAVGLVNRVVHAMLAEMDCHQESAHLLLGIDGTGEAGSGSGGSGSGADDTCQPPTVLWLLFLHVAIVPLQGFGNAVVYGELPRWLGHVTGLWASEAPKLGAATKLSFSK